MKRSSSLFPFPSSLFTARSIPPLFTFLFSLFVAVAAQAAATMPFVVNPYTFVGRISDSHGAAFDNERTATLTACAVADGRKLAETDTFFHEDSRNNYALQIPMVSSPVDGFAQQGDLLAVAATDDAGRTWAGVIDPAVVGAPGTVAEVDIVLAEDADGDGIDDALYAELMAEWAASGAAAGGGAFDPKADHDGDGMSTLDEALLGTDPFDAGDVLRIESIEGSEDAVILTFELPGGHAYAVQESGNLLNKDSWTDAEFVPEESTLPRTLLVTPSSTDRTTFTVYLFPASLPAFYRLNVK
jgi:hypothetical protein